MIRAHCVRATITDSDQGLRRERSDRKEPQRSGKGEDAAAGEAASAKSSSGARVLTAFAPRSPVQIRDSGGNAVSAKRKRAKREEEGIAIE